MTSRSRDKKMEKWLRECGRIREQVDSQKNVNPSRPRYGKMTKSRQRRGAGRGFKKAEKKNTKRPARKEKRSLRPVTYPRSTVISPDDLALRICIWIGVEATASATATEYRGLNGVTESAPTDWMGDGLVWFVRKWRKDDG